MKKVFCFVAFLLLSSCGIIPLGPDTSDYVARTRTVDYFEEWNLLRFSGLEVFVKGETSVIQNELDFVCEKIFGPFDYYAARLYQDEQNDSIKIECLSLIPYPARTSSSLEVLTRALLGTPTYLINVDSSITAVYGGGVDFVSKDFSAGRLLCEKKDVSECSFEGSLEGDKENFHFEGPFYDISIPYKSSYSVVIRKSSRDLKGYKPLRLDPSILPLESPGYKKLREQEESLKE